MLFHCIPTWARQLFDDVSTSGTNFTDTAWNMSSFPLCLLKSVFLRAEEGVNRSGSTYFHHVILGTFERFYPARGLCITVPTCPQRAVVLSMDNCSWEQGLHSVVQQKTDRWISVFVDIINNPCYIESRLTWFPTTNAPNGVFKVAFDWGDHWHN